MNYQDPWLISHLKSHHIFSFVAVVDLFSKEYADGAVKLTLAAGEVAPLDASTCAYEIGCYKFDDKDGKEVDNGK